MVLAIAGSVLGLLVASGSTQLLLSAISEDVARDLLAGGSVTLDWRVLLVTTTVTFAAGIFFGLAPALALSRVDAGSALTSRTTAGPGAATIRRTLTIAEVGLAVVLLVGSGLLIRSFMNLTSVDLGFAPTDVVIGRMSLQGTSAESADARQRLLEQGLARIRELPGVTAVAVSNSIPIEAGLNLAMAPPPGALIDQTRSMDWRYVSPEYFSLFRMATRVGTTFTDDHGAGRPLVAVVNETFARTYFGRVDAVGQTIAFGNDGPREIIGVVADVKGRSNAGFVRNLTLGALGAASSPAVYVPVAQAPDAGIQIANRFFDMKWIVRSNRPSGALESGMREAVRIIDPTLAFIRFETMTSIIRRDLDMQRLLTILLGAFATSAMLLAAVGLYGLVAYAAVRRRKEVGIRMALGATAARVVKAFVAEGLALASIGLLLGMAGAVALTRLLSSRLFGVTPLDAATFSVAALALIAVATCAALVPATNAAKTNPVEALRGE